MFHSVIIATKGRPLILQETLASLANQDCPPDEIIISATDRSDVEGVIGSDIIKVVQGPVGLCHQRNTGLRALDPRCELVSFLDDDVELATDYCHQLRHFMQENQGVIGVGGRLLLNGTTREEAQTATFPSSCWRAVG